MKAGWLDASLALRRLAADIKYLLYIYRKYNMALSGKNSIQHKLSRYISPLLLGTKE